MDDMQGLASAKETQRLQHECSSEEVYGALQISEQNLFVRLHRARRALAP